MKRTTGHSEYLDPVITRELETLAESIPMRTDFLDTLEEQLLQTDPGSALNNSQPLPVRRGLASAPLGWISAHLPRVPPIAIRLVSAATLLVIFSLAVWRTHPPTVSAAEILERAQLSINNSRMFGVQTYHSTVLINSRPDAAQPLQQWQRQVWYQAPQHLRIEEGNSAPMDAPLSGAPISLVVTNGGADLWRYDSVTRQAHLYGKWGISALTLTATDPQQLLTNPRPDFSDSQLLGQERLLDRVAYVLYLTWAPGHSGGVHSKTWIDTQTYLPLRTEEYDVQGNVLTTWRLTQLDINPALPTATFDFSPSVSDTIIWHRDPTEVELNQRWSQVAQQVTYLVFKPAWLPEGLRIGAPNPNSQQKQMVEQYYLAKGWPSMPDWGVGNPGSSAGQPSPSWTLRIQQTQASAVVTDPQGEGVSIASFVGYYSQQANRVQLRFQRDGTQILLEEQLIDLTEVQIAIIKAELLKIATHLQPVVSHIVP